MRCWAAGAIGAPGNRATLECGCRAVKDEHRTDVQIEKLAEAPK